MFYVFYAFVQQDFTRRKASLLFVGLHEFETCMYPYFLGAYCHMTSSFPHSRTVGLLIFYSLQHQRPRGRPLQVIRCQGSLDCRHPLTGLEQTYCIDQYVEKLMFGFTAATYVLGLVFPQMIVVFSESYHTSAERPLVDIYRKTLLVDGLNLRFDLVSSKYDHQSRSRRR